MDFNFWKINKIVQGTMTANPNFVLKFKAQVKDIYGTAEDYTVGLKLLEAEGTFHEAGDTLHYSNCDKYLDWEFQHN